MTIEMESGVQSNSVSTQIAASSGKEVFVGQDLHVMLSSRESCRSTDFNWLENRLKELTFNANEGVQPQLNILWLVLLTGNFHEDSVKIEQELKLGLKEYLDNNVIGKITLTFLNFHSLTED